MPATLSCTVSKIITIPTKVNADIVSEFWEFMRQNGASGIKRPRRYRYCQYCGS